MGRWLGLTALVVATAFSAVLVAYAVAAQPRGVEYVRVVPRGFEYAPFTTYVAELYVGDRVVRSLYVRVVELGRYSELLVSLGWREGSEVRSLEVVVYPPPGPTGCPRPSTGPSLRPWRVPPQLPPSRS